MLRICLRGATFRVGLIVDIAATVVIAITIGIRFGICIWVCFSLGLRLQAILAIVLLAFFVLLVVCLSLANASTELQWQQAHAHAHAHGDIVIFVILPFHVHPARLWLHFHRLSLRILRVLDAALMLAQIRPLRAQPTLAHGAKHKVRICLVQYYPWI